MDEPLENLYFNWLCAKVVNMKELPDPFYWELLKKLHKTEYVWMMSGDDNRAEDGKELRRDFIFQAEIPDDPYWRIALGCSMLEMLIAFSRRAEFQDDTPAHQWFWEFIDNLGLTDNHDENFDEEYVEMVLYELIWRTYKPDGSGGLFPIMHPSGDQKEIEIWYQFCEYLVDTGRIA
jgi:hypothetical protein